MNNNKSIHNLDEKLYDFGKSKARNDLFNSRSGFILAVPVPFKPVPQRLNVELIAEGGNLQGKHIIYSEVVRKI